MDSLYTDSGLLHKDFLEHMTHKNMLILACEKSGNQALIDRARKMQPCGRRLLYAITDDGEVLLDSALFCRQRLCPVCQWRRSLKAYKVMHAACEHLGEGYSYQLLTMSRPNVKFSELAAEITTLNRNSSALFREGRVKAAVHGFYRAMEVTYNPDRDDYHPHFHVITAVKPSYYNSRYFIKRADMVDMWNRCNGHDRAAAGFDLSLDWRKVRNLDHDISEVAKYCTKPLSGYAHSDNSWEAVATQANMVNEILSGKRLVQTSGVIRDAIRITSDLRDLEDPEDLSDGVSEDHVIKRMGYRYSDGEYQRYF